MKRSGAAGLDDNTSAAFTQANAARGIVVLVVWVALGSGRVTSWAGSAGTLPLARPGDTRKPTCIHHSTCCVHWPDVAACCCTTMSPSKLRCQRGQLFNHPPSLLRTQLCRFSHKAPTHTCSHREACRTRLESASCLGDLLTCVAGKVNTSYTR